MNEVLYYGGIISAIFFFLLAVLLFFWQDIPGTIAYFQNLKAKQGGRENRGTVKTGALDTAAMESRQLSGHLSGAIDPDATQILDEADDGLDFGKTEIL